MARVSRKNKKTSSEQVLLSERKRNLVGIYVRLSVTCPNYKTRDSIYNQIVLLNEYVKEHNEELSLVKVYSDSGATGTSFVRAGWNQMIRDIETGIIDCILVKDLSRIGRNYIETGSYLERVFPFLGVRVISVNEHYDSKGSSDYMMLNSLTNLMNEFYARDISRKTSAAKHALQKKGCYIAGIPPYGYKKSELDRRILEDDSECSHVVKQIFAWRADGKGCGVIANYLNVLAVPSPGLYRFQNGDMSFQRCCHEKWKSKHVAEILKNPVYLGHMVQGRTKSSYFVQEGRQRPIPKEQWVVVENTHKPLATQEQFLVAAKMAEQSKKKHQEQLERNREIPHIDQPIRKKIFCGQCGNRMTRRNRVRKEIRDYFYYCTTSKLSFHCVGTYIHEIPLLEAVMDEVEQHVGGHVESLDMLDDLIEKIIIYPYGRQEIIYVKHN